jgi:HEAT repeat protein
VRRLSAQTLWPMQIGDKSVVLAFAYALSDEDETVRQYCINGLSTLGGQAKLGSAKIKEALTDKNEHVRVQAYYLLNSFGEDLKPTMQKALKHKDVRVRINMASLMVSVNQQRDDAVPILVETLKSDDRGLKMQAAFTLAQHQLQTDKLLPLFVDGLKDKSAGARAQAANGLAMLQKGASAAAPALAEMLRDPDANVRQQAIYALHSVGGMAEAVVPILSKIFKEGDAGMRGTVLQVAWVYGGKAKDIFIGGLNDKNADVRQQAVNSLQNGQQDLTELVPAIVELVKDKKQSLRVQLVWLFQRTGEAGVPHLAELLKDEDVSMRVSASHILQNLGAKAAKAMPAIKAALKDDNAQVRLAAMHLVATVGGEGAAFLVKQFPAEKDPNMRANLLQIMAQTPDRKLALPLLKTAMSDPSAQVRLTTINVLGNFGQDSKEGFEAFVLGLKDADNQIRINAGHHGSYYGQKSWGPLEAALAFTKDSGFRQAILQCLEGTSYRSKTGVTPLMECLKDADPSVRHLACNVLGNIGPDAANALPQLRALAKDNVPTVQQAAQGAIKRIEQPKK